ncbi:hypothetical protein DdX_02867 [Ditylenchus destructor]|uniref:Uncharacterized protein n=1 Tax=Ditylenchus destructor TaxID=166010 RepID=A0AAD4RCK2_9BILA|nr:hypothetical protein DdX_02867 [Ditylenchus destructor]
MPHAVVVVAPGAAAVLHASVVTRRYSSSYHEHARVVVAAAHAAVVALVVAEVVVEGGKDGRRSQRFSEILCFLNRVRTPQISIKSCIPLKPHPLWKQQQNILYLGFTQKSESGKRNKRIGSRLHSSQPLCQLSKVY